MNITNGFRFDNAVAPLFQSVPDTRVQESSMTAHTILMIYQITGPLNTDP